MLTLDDLRRDPMLTDRAESLCPVVIGARAKPERGIDGVGAIAGAGRDAVHVSHSPDDPVAMLAVEGDTSLRAGGLARYTCFIHEGLLVGRAPGDGSLAGAVL